jgi:hypothetical protein
MFPELRGLVYTDDGTTIVRFSQTLKLVDVRNRVFQSDTERAQYFLQTDPDLQVIVNDFTPEMFTTTGIEVLGTPIVTDTYIKDFVTQNSIKIMRNVEKLEPLTDGFTHFQLVHKTMNTLTQYMTVNITLPPQ